MELNRPRETDFLKDVYYSVIDVTWRGTGEGQSPPNIFYNEEYLKGRQIKNWDENGGERSVCILRTVSNQSPPSF